MTFMPLDGVNVTFKPNDGGVEVGAGSGRTGGEMPADSGDFVAG